MNSRLATPDRAIAEAITCRLTESDRDVCIVGVIGSRAKGKARASSDLDLVVIKELPSTVPPWTGADADRARSQLMRFVPCAPFPVDLTVRSSQQYLDARGVFGGVEQLLDREGAVVYRRSLTSKPRPRSNLESVKVGLTMAWIQAALRTLFELKAFESQAATSSRMPDKSSGQRNRVLVCLPPKEGHGSIPTVTRHFEGPSDTYHATQALYQRIQRQTITALCVRYQVESEKADRPVDMVRRLRERAPIPATLEGMLEREASSIMAASLLSHVISMIGDRTYSRYATWVAERRRVNAVLTQISMRGVSEI